MKQGFKFQVLIGTASMVAILTATYAQMMLLNIPSINIRPGESFTVKINISAPEEFSLAKITDMGDQKDISHVFLQYIKNEGLINVTNYDSRITFFGNASVGQAWFKFVNFNVNDSGTYGVLYKKPNSADLFTTTFHVNVTRAYLQATVSTQALRCHAKAMTFDCLLLVAITLVRITIQL